MMQEIYTDSSTHGCSHFAQRSASPHSALFMPPTLTQLHVDVELSEQKIWRRLARTLLFAAPCAKPSLSPPYSPLVPYSEKHILVRDERGRDCGAAAVYLAVGQYRSAHIDRNAAAQQHGRTLTRRGTFQMCVDDRGVASCQRDNI
jgi:hypothetical protein